MLTDRRTLLRAGLAAGGIVMATRSLAQGQNATLRVGVDKFPATLVPSRATDQTGSSMMLQMHSRLLKLSVKGELVPGLAESWKPDGDTAWLFALRDAKFSDGSRVTAEDVRWSFERLANASVGSNLRPFFQQIEAVEPIDARTVRVKTNGTDASLPYLAATQGALILKRSDDPAQEIGIGAGPFILKSQEQGVALNFVRNPHYYEAGFPKFENLRITVVNDENLRVTALLSGDVDFINFIPWQSMSEIERNPRVTLLESPTGAFNYLTFSGKGPFADVRLRKAVAFGLRREEFVKAVFYGRGKPLEGPPRVIGSPYYHEDAANHFRYNPGLSKSLMREAGVADGFNCTLLAASDYAMHRDSGVLVKTQLAELGIRVNLVLNDFTTRQAMGNKGVGDMGINGTGIETPDPGGIQRVVDPSLGVATMRSHSFEVPGLAELYARAKAELDPAIAVEIYRKADGLTNEYASFCGLCYRSNGFAFRNELKGFELLPAGASVTSMCNLYKVSM
ncbi:ABC transporter substrate-binding protein [Bradyrhizobium sp. BWA-3-5]|uniref:ABC transporter substrate-binding protein n=1 Tax=Bradyrhizobium sp. BWA-3-5 TaxID=3080013 RepID=UPI00293F518F|nr:ABC transporter substrate-binding protein [Bradyrhizobium sp. BWA-3-5]WOH63746.1 ABC transporter substrate-binding protein [Bradyrhizobium sp. BWA-3-5]